MQIVIDMPDSTTKEMLENFESGSLFDEVLRGALKRAIILPKGHGRLIDENKITRCEQIGLVIKDESVTRCLKTDAPTILEADKLNDD